MDSNALRSEIYLVLSEAFKQPTAEFIAEQSDIVFFLRQSLKELGYEISDSFYIDWPFLASSLSSLTDDYHKSFIFPLQSRVVPIESIYRRWTYDKTTESAVANMKGLLMSDHALHAATLYDTYGLAIPPEYNSMPDHISLELEFAAFLLEKNKNDHFYLFLSEHLNWLDELVQDSEKQNIPIYYRQLIKLTAQFLSWELRRQEEVI